MVPIDDIAYFQGCPTGTLLSQLGWREDFLAYPEDFPTTPRVREHWAHQASLIRQELAGRGASP